MKFRNNLLLAVIFFISTSAYAKDLRISIGESELASDLNVIYPAETPLIDFHHVCKFNDTVFTTADIYVYNDSGVNLDDFTVSIPGNSREFLKTSDVCGPHLAHGASCSLTIKLLPAHFGKKRKKLNFDATFEDENGVNDFSLTIPLLGKTEPATPLNNYGGDLICEQNFLDESLLGSCTNTDDDDFDGLIDGEDPDCLL